MGFITIPQSFTRYRLANARVPVSLLADAVQYRNRSFCYAATDTLAVI